MRKGDPSVTLRRVLVAGTGRVDGMPIGDMYAAKAIGAELARNRYGLITGGWPGVDYLATESFLNEINKSQLKPIDYLVQVISKIRKIDHEFGQIVEASEGPNEWLTPQKYADAVIIIGGVGGTYKTWLGALHEGIPRFPLGGTPGDAELAFLQTKELWELTPVPGLTLGQFNRLEKKIDSLETANEVAKYIVEELLWRSLSAFDESRRESLESARSLFISYSRKDFHWVSRLRTFMQPAEHRGLFTSWVDSDIKPGEGWEPQLLSKLDSADAALLLVSPELLKSQYVREKELPAIESRLKAGKFHLFWVLLEKCDWRDISVLNEIQAIGDVNSSVSESPTTSDEQCRLKNIVEKIANTLSPS